MSQFTHLSLIQFRNYQSASFSFKERIVGIAGANGSGKTNLLDAIYYLCFTRSYFSRPDSKNALHGTDGFRLEGQIKAIEGKEGGALGTDIGQVVCIVRPGDKKEILVNQVGYERFSEHIGRLPAVMIAPDDSVLITGGSEERRKFIDTILSQTDAQYLSKLIDYNKILQQRNAWLKSAAHQGTQDAGLLAVLDQQLCQVAAPIYEARKAFVASFIPSVIQEYQAIAGKSEWLALHYDSPLSKNSMKALLDKNRERDFYLQRTTQGVHRDDLSISLEELPFKSIGSQGQRKSLLFALKLASYYYIAERKQNPPILLLDDVFEKLDQDRMLNLLKQVTLKLKGQVFITDTHKERLESAFEALQEPCQLIELTTA